MSGTVSLAAAGRHYWTHDLDPVIVRLTDRLALRWYGLAYALGALVGWWLLRRLARRGRLPLHPAQVEELVLYGAFLPMFVGGRLGYCLLYAWADVVRDPLYLLRVWEGGMASHGGIAGLALGVAWWARRHRLPVLDLYDGIAAVAPFGVFLGRIANFINGELWGRKTTVPWAVIFPEATTWADGGVPTPRHPSQLYAAALEGLVVFVVGMSTIHRTRRAGATAGAVVIAYAVVRLVYEMFREPDAGYQLYWGVFSKGQLFSIPLLALGVFLLWCAARRRPPETAPR